MPGYKTHLVGGVLTFVVVFWGIKQVISPSLSMSSEWFLCTLAGSLFPDIDTPSMARIWFYRILLGIMTFFAFSNAPIKLFMGFVVGLIPFFARHRGVFHTMHTIVFSLILGAAASYYLVPALSRAIVVDLGFFALGIVSHLYLDMGIRGLYR